MEQREANVRVVSCPKCDKLLPELANLKIYKCGDCDTIPRAKGLIPIPQTSSEIADGKEVEHLSEDTVDNARDSPRIWVRREGRLILNEPSYDEPKSVPRSEDGSGRESSRTPKASIGNSIINSGKLAKKCLQEYCKTNTKFGHTTNGIHDLQEVQGSKRVVENELPRTPIPKEKGIRLVPLSDEGPSNYHSSSSNCDGYSADDPSQKPNRDEPKKVEHRDPREQYRAKLLKKFDELRGQLGRSCHATDKLNKRVTVNRAKASSSYNKCEHSMPHQGGSPSLIQASIPHSPLLNGRCMDRRVKLREQYRAELLKKFDELGDRLKKSCGVMDKKANKKRVSLNKETASSGPYNKLGHGMPFPDGSPSSNPTSFPHCHLLNGHCMPKPPLHPAFHARNSFHGCMEAIQLHTPMMAPLHPPGHIPQGPSNSYIYRHFDPDRVISYHPDGFYHQHYHACLHCCMPPAHVPPNFFSNQMLAYPIDNNRFFPVEDPSTPGPISYDHRVTSAALNSHKSGIKQRAVQTKNYGRLFRPINGAAPFIVCNNCFELLQLPEDIYLMERNNQWKLRCGSCSQVNSMKEDGKIIITNTAPTMHEASDNNNDSSDRMKETLPCHDLVNQQVGTYYSGEYDSTSYEIHSTDEKLVFTSLSSQEIEKRIDGLSLNEPENFEVSSGMLEIMESPISMICEEDIPNSSDFPTEAEVTSEISSLRHQGHFVDTESYQLIDKSGKGSDSQHSDEGKIVPSDVNFEESPLKDVPLATEMDISVHEYHHPDKSQDSWEGSKDEDKPRIYKSDEVCFVGLINRKCKDVALSNQSIENVGSEVIVNEHPISDDIVQKAQKLAGPIHPGEYWYDYKAGFWGVMGQQCLGIIPPCIDEFNYPMPKNCAGGNTGVYVNGRELHQKDFDLLVGRGLPTTEGQSYIIEISGKVWDEASGEYLGSLGNLAPTVERLKHGLGMRVPGVGA